MFWHFLNHWWNLPSLVMLGLVGVYFALQAIGLAGHSGGSEAGADADAEADAEVEADQELAQDFDGAHDAADGAPDPHGEAAHEHEPDAESDPGSVLLSLAAFLGVGRVPFMVVWLTLFIFAGFTGLFANKIVWDMLDHSYPGWFFGVSVALSLLVGASATRLSSGLVSRLVDVGGRGAPRKKDLAGQPGVVASPRIDASFGEVRVKGAHGDELLVHAKVHAGDPALPQGTRVVLTEYDEAQDLFTVAALGALSPAPGDAEGPRPLPQGAVRDKLR